MSIDGKAVKKIGHLARLAVEPDQVDQYAKDLSNILDLFEQLAKVDTENIEPLAHSLDMPQRLRPDVVTETNQRDHFQENAPMKEAGLYLVPAVIE